MPFQSTVLFAESMADKTGLDEAARQRVIVRFRCHGQSLVLNRELIDLLHRTTSPISTRSSLRRARKSVEKPASSRALALRHAIAVRQ